MRQWKCGPVRSVSSTDSPPRRSPARPCRARRWSRSRAASTPGPVPRPRPAHPRPSPGQGGTRRSSRGLRRARHCALEHQSQRILTHRPAQQAHVFARNGKARVAFFVPGGMGARSPLGWSGEEDRVPWTPRSTCRCRLRPQWCDFRSCKLLASTNVAKLHSRSHCCSDLRFDSYLLCSYLGVV